MQKSGPESTAHEVAGTSPPEEKVAALRAIIEKLHRGATPDEVRAEFEANFGAASAAEIAAMEQELIRNGLPVEEIHRLCDVHVGVFRNSLDRDVALATPAGHPIHTYMAENRAAERAANAWCEVCRRFDSANPPDKDEALAALDRLAQVEIHYTRKENQLFPRMERDNFTGPSKVMWSIHDEIRSEIAALRQSIAAGATAGLVTAGLELARKITEMIYKEEKILFPTALTLIREDHEWLRIHAGDDEIGYAFGVVPGNEWQPTPAHAPTPAATTQHEAAAVPLSNGALTPQQLSTILTLLPVEMSFVDAEDTVRFYSNHADRIFPRSPEVIGRKVQNCHPHKSVHIVEAILKAFRDGSRDKAQFWLTLQGRFIVISYFAIRDDQGSYLGCLEVSQDATGLRALEGENRLLNWE